MVDNDKLEEYLQKWINHLRFMEIVKKSNINKELVDVWEHKINFNFKEKIEETIYPKSKL